MPDDVRMRGFSVKTDLDMAMNHLRSAVKPLTAEVITLEAALGRTLAQDVVSSEAVPGFDKSAMDGFALKAAETFGASPTDPASFRVIGEVVPGEVGGVRVGTGEAVRIMTGGVCAEGSDAVLMAEYATDQRDTVLANAPVVPGKNVALAGEDIKKGDRVLKKGRVLKPQDLGVLASIRRTKVEVTRQPVVGILSAGNEVVEPDSPEAGVPGRVVNSCRYMLQGLVAQEGAVPRWLGTVPDDPVRLRNAMEAFDGDILLTTGATSTGKEDFLPVVLSEIGELLVHGVNIRPASPVAFGKLGEALAVLLPGNPVAALVGFDVFVRVAIRIQLDQEEGRGNRRVRGRMRRKLASALNRTDFVRVRLMGDGEVEPLRSSGAGILTSVTRADGFVIVPRDEEGFEAGTEVEVYLY
ncbi:MAG: molybdopterin molybdotransferase MoeA [Gemmatimonadetes bacterium]|nr:molybdopterin molybdotransferase MoeA [Gemmatimonadota bacterium]